MLVEIIGLLAVKNILKSVEECAIICNEIHQELKILEELPNGENTQKT